MEAGFLGVGYMGLPMADLTLDGGHRLTVHDIREALADQCEIVFVSLPTLAARRAVMFGEAGLIHGKAMRLLVNTCTVGVPFVKEIEQALRTAGSHRDRLPHIRQTTRRKGRDAVRDGIRPSRDGGAGCGDDPGFELPETR